MRKAMSHEILVHIAAPTTKEEDDRYRAEALAYRTFKSSRIIYLDRRDGEATASTFQHPRHHALQEEYARENHGSSLRTLGLDSFSITEPDLSNSAPGLPETEAIMDTQRALGALESQISTITNSFYDEESLSWAERRPAKRSRTAEPIMDRSSSSRGAILASNPPSSSRSPYACEISFSGFEPVSSQLPESYGLSKSGGSNSIRRPEEAATLARLPPFPASPQMLRPDISGGCYTPEANDAAALLLGLRARESPAISSNSTITSPSQVDHFAVDRVLDSFRDSLNIPGQRLSTPVRKLFTDNVDAVQQTSVTRVAKEKPSLCSDVTRDYGPRYEVLPIPVRFHEKELGGRTAREFNERSASLVEEGVDDNIVQMEKERHVSPEPLKAQNKPAMATSTIEKLPSTPIAKIFDKRTKQVPNVNSLPLEVFSPKAPVGNSGPITFVTPTLTNFMAKPQLRNRWKRASIISRPITQFEMGHWVIETKTWTLKLQLSFWKDLTKQITLRQAGISTWCKRIPELDQLGTVKVFCWGEIVEHLYLFLFTIADTGVSSQEVCWLDGKSEVVVRVRYRQSAR